jgi:hypothetical protein
LARFNNTSLIHDKAFSFFPVGPSQDGEEPQDERIQAMNSPQFATFTGLTGPCGKWVREPSITIATSLIDVERTLDGNAGSS